MFELRRRPSEVISVVFLDRKQQKSQRVSVPTVHLFFSMSIGGPIA